MRAPVLAVGDGALGFWKALREVFPATREQRCWVHKLANVVDGLPKTAHPAAKNAIAEIYNAEDKDQASRAIRAFERQYGAKFPKAVAKIVDDEDVLLAFYDYPAEHWIHLRTTNPIESTFATVRLRTKVTRGAGSRTAALAMTFKLIESAQERAGAWSTRPIWSPWSAPEPVSSAASWSNARSSPPPDASRPGNSGVPDHAPAVVGREDPAQGPEDRPHRERYEAGHRADVMRLVMSSRFGTCCSPRCEAECDIDALVVLLGRAAADGDGPDDGVAASDHAGAGACDDRRPGDMGELGEDGRPGLLELDEVGAVAAQQGDARRFLRGDARGQRRCAVHAVHEAEVAAFVGDRDRQPDADRGRVLLDAGAEVSGFLLGERHRLLQFLGSTNLGWTKSSANRGTSQGIG